MYRITGVIQGLAPLLFNRPDPAIIEPDSTTRSSSGRVSKEQRIAIAENRAYNDDGGLYVPGSMFKACLIEGCKKSGLKVKRASLAPFLKASVFLDLKLYFGKEKFDFMHENWGRVPPRTGAVVILRRPALNLGWLLPFGMNVVDDRIASGDIQRSLEEAGLLVGIGSWRPEYGRFIITEWNAEA